jgi:hypothetical protein
MLQLVPWRYFYSTSEAVLWFGWGSYKGPCVRSLGRRVVLSGDNEPFRRRGPEGGHQVIGEMPLKGIMGPHLLPISAFVSWLLRWAVCPTMSSQQDVLPHTESNNGASGSRPGSSKSVKQNKPFLYIIELPLVCHYSDIKLIHIICSLHSLLPTY